MHGWKQVGRALVAALAGLSVWACAPPAAERAPSPALFRIADADNTIWIFGTSHLLKPETEWRSPAFEAAFAAAERLVIETDTGPEGQAALQQLAAQHAALPASETLDDRLSPDGRARLARLARKFGIDPQNLQRLRPWMAGLQLSLAALAAEGHEAASGVETILTAEAARRGLPVGTLESAEVQIMTLAGLSPAEEARFLEATLRQIDEEPDDVDKLDAAWASGDLGALEALTLPPIREGGEAFYEAVLVRRNTAWAAEIQTMLATDDDILVAVGAAHLVGPDSLIALLDARGVEAERVE